MSKWNGKRFSVYTSEEKSTLGLIKELGEQTNFNTEEAERIERETAEEVERIEREKTDLYGDHKGSWQGLNKPTLSEEGMRATVEQLTDETIPNIETQMASTKTELEKGIWSVVENKYKMTFNKKQLGVNIQNPMSLTTLQSKFDLMKEIGIHSIVICPTGNLATKTSNEIIEDTISYEDVRLYTQICQDAGFIVHFKLHIEVKDSTWRAEIAPSDIDTFFTNYKNFIIKYATLAEELGVKLFCVGEEMLSISGSTYTAKWHDIFTALKTVYTGKTTYGANLLMWDDEHRRNVIFQYVDYLGIDLWAKQADVDGNARNNYTTINGWIIPTFEELYNTYGKKIILTEVGYFPTKEGATIPNDSGSQTWTIDYNLQARYYRTLFQNCLGQEWFEDIWYWAEKDSSFTGPALDRYSVLHPSNTPTQKLFKSFKEE